MPTGEIVAIPSRGALMGNRGILHNTSKKLGVSRWQHPHWVTCVLSFKNRHRPVMTPRRYTELFFLDEPTALAAGHRPCGECRRQDFLKFKLHFSAANKTTNLREIDELMQAQRVRRDRMQVRYQACAMDLPDGTFVMHKDKPYLVWRSALYQFTPSGYGGVRDIPSEQVTVLTPRCTVQTLSNGYSPTPHASIERL
ncbi:MAG: hypothetical protein AAGF53_07700 [Pseudomonadota bacterium]